VIIWLAVNINIGGSSVFAQLASFLEPIGKLAGMDGVMMCAFICALPAAEIMLPLAIMGYSGGNAMIFGESANMAEIFSANGWTAVTVICVIVFTLFHFPCATTLMTIKKETGSIKWTIISALLPTVIGYLICVLINLVV